MATLFSVSWTYKYFMGSLLSIPLHRLEQISFSATPGMATLFSFYFDLQILLWVLCFPYPTQIGAD